ncbi:hypothetical protein [Chengkuizengella sediminis]|uniref:hypothetical protein n=1 Tax=Chengkuizengella sediminis TaxID=1885917 RepID=UPI00138A3814|nr:hypothetical protein [Chengkuizengella sediminis]NDI35636.1 hypothetical protein [Chengkuizengella sediminis]
MSGHSGSGAAIVLVLFILLVIILIASVRKYNGSSVAFDSGFPEFDDYREKTRFRVIGRFVGFE